MKVSLENVLKDGIQGGLIDGGDTHIKVMVDMSL